jgi:hypothetical protein
MNKKLIIGLGIAALAFIGIQASAAAPAASGNQPLLITDHDAAYDYQYANGRWYTRRKGNEAWIDMQANLSAANYTLAISRLTSFLNQKGINL